MNNTKHLKEVDLRSGIITIFKSYFNPIKYGEKVLELDPYKHYLYLNFVFGLIMATFVATFLFLEKEYMTSVFVFIGIIIGNVLMGAFNGLFVGGISYLAFRVLNKSKLSFWKTVGHFYGIMTIIFVVPFVILMPFFLLASLVLNLNLYVGIAFFILTGLVFFIATMYLYIYTPLISHKTYNLTIGEAFLAGLLYYLFSQIAGFFLMILIYGTIFIVALVGFGVNIFAI